MLPRIAILLLLHAARARALEEGKICFNGCSGHGACANFVCSCEPGWTGDDCSHSLVGGNATVQTLTAGHFNVTAKNWTKLLKKKDVVFIAFGSRSCLRCVGAETAYADAAPLLKKMGVPLARADADEPFFRELLQDLQLGSMPQVVAYRKLFAMPYQGVHAPDELVAFGRKLKQAAAPVLLTLNAALQFLGVADERAEKARAALRAETGVIEEEVTEDALPSSAARVLGLFSDAQDIEDEESAEFMVAASERRSRHDVYFARIDDPQISQALVDAGLADRTPAVIVANDGQLISHVLDDAPDIGLGPWVDAETLPAVGELTHQNFARYEALSRPMLLLFLDLRGHDRGMELSGLSGGVPNRDLVEEFRAVRKDESFRDRVAFAYVDGVAQQDRMKALGLFGGARRLPAVAVNAKEEGVIAPYPESLPLDRAHLRDFLGAFLARRLRSKEDSDAFALQRKDDVFDAKWLPKRKPRKKPTEEVMGRYEVFGEDSIRAREVGKIDDVFVLNRDNFAEALADKDVLILFHEEGCEACAALTVYYKKMAERFASLKIPSLVIARFDVTKETPPLDGLIAGPLPVVVLLPAHDKRPPFRFYSGLGKVQPMMKWVQASSDIAFDLPELCHLDPSEIEAYKHQVTERERRRRGEL